MINILTTKQLLVTLKYSFIVVSIILQPKCQLFCIYSKNEKKQLVSNIFKTTKTLLSGALGSCIIVVNITATQ